MFVEFNTLPIHSKIWIYQANRSFSEAELVEIHQKLKTFITEWSAHGQGLKASYTIRYKRFIIIAVDQGVHAASGCSIDTSVRFIKELENTYKVDLLDKMNVSYKQGEFVAYKSLTDFKKMVKNKAVSPSTIVFNNLVNNIEEYQTHWELPIKESWHNRFLN